MRFYRLLLVFISVLWLLTAGACSASNPETPLAGSPTRAPSVIAATATKPAPTASPPPSVVPTLSPTNTPIPTPTKLPVFALGQPASLGDLGLAVIKVENVTDPTRKALFVRPPGTDPFLIVTVLVRNSTTANQVFQFSKLHLNRTSSSDSDLLLCNPYASSFYQVLQPGDTLRYGACWTIPTGEGLLSLTYQAKDKQVLATWDVSTPGEAAASAEFSTPTLTADMHSVGKIVQFLGITVTLTKAETIHSVNPGSSIDFTRVRFYFTYENKGSSDATLPNEFLGNYRFISLNGDLFTRTVDPECGAPGFGSEIMKPGEKRSERFCLTTIGKIETAGGRLLSYVSTAKNQYDFINWLIK